MDPLLKYSAIRDVRFGDEVTVVQPVNLYECTIGDRVFIGPFVEIQKEVSIGNDTRIQSHSFICQGVTIGKKCFVAHGVMFVNDRFRSGKPAGGDPGGWEKTKIGDDVSIGSNATILPVTICDGTVIGAGAVVTKNIAVAGFYAGNPAKLLRKLG